MSIPCSQNYMAAGWDEHDRDLARIESQLAHPQWERAGTADKFNSVNQACARCEVTWFSSNEFTRCWMCLQSPTGHGMPWIIGQLNPYNTRGDYEYADQPSTPAGGCGCPDATPSRVAQLIADGADLHAACLAIYGGAA